MASMATVTPIASERPLIFMAGDWVGASLEWQVEYVLDTGALIEMPLHELRVGLSAISQMDEVERHSPERAMILESQGPVFATPQPESVKSAHRAATASGDISGLSEVDVEVLALALESGLPLVTDDYRLQNICESLGHSWRPAVTEGIKERWSWQLVCPGCGTIAPAASSPTKSRGEHGNCADCGAGLRLRRG
jgi:rRNA maturation endonuclease Nob1